MLFLYAPAVLIEPLPISVHLFELSWALLFWRNVTLALCYIWLELHLPVVVFQVRFAWPEYWSLSRMNASDGGIGTYLRCSASQGWPSGTREHSFLRRRAASGPTLCNLKDHHSSGSGRGFYTFFFSFLIVFSNSIFYSFPFLFIIAIYLVSFGRYANMESYFLSNLT